MGDLAHLLPQTWKKHVALWLEDDIPSYDIGGFVVGGACSLSAPPSSLSR
jgi:nicotinate-nucleotide pyrophosphorylase (carboxylating)